MMILWFLKCLCSYIFDLRKHVQCFTCLLFFGYNLLKATATAECCHEQQRSPLFITNGHSRCSFCGCRGSADKFHMSNQTTATDFYSATDYSKADERKASGCMGIREERAVG